MDLHSFQMKVLNFEKGAQWLIGRVLDSRLKGCVVVLEQDTFILA